MALKFYSRLDGRYFHQIRPVKITNDPIISSFSSIQMSIGYTKVIVCFFKESIDEEKYSESFDLNLYLIKPILKNDLLIHQKERIKKIINNLYPWKKLQMKILIDLLIIENDGDFLMVALNAIFLAIGKTNFFPEIEVMCCSIGLLKNFKKLIINPRKVEELFIIGYFYFIEVKNKKKKNELISFYSGQFSEKCKNVYKKTIKFGQNYLKLLNELIKY